MSALEISELTKNDVIGLNSINVRFGNFFSAQAHGWGLAALVAIQMLLIVAVIWSDKLRDLMHVGVQLIT